MSFKIDFFSQNQNNKLTLGPRKLRSAGKDIIVVKLFLGLLKPLNAEGSYTAGTTPENLNLSVPLDEQKWFQCSNGKGIDSIKAATFDVELKMALSQYQIENRLLITSYLFEKYFISDILSTGYENIESTEEFERYKLLVKDKYFQLSALFDLEFGHIDEATIAVMHGYTPGRYFTESGYIHSSSVFEGSPIVYSIVPEQMILDLQQGILGPPRIRLIEDSVIVDAKLGMTLDEYEDFDSTASSSRNWIRLERLEATENENVVFLQPFNYGLISYPVQTTFTSQLYKYSQAILSVPDPIGLLDIDPVYKRDQARKFFEPDPFTDPAPFIIDENRIGYFYKTNFLLSPDGPFPSSELSAIQELEDRALESVLRAFDKPLIWNIFIKNGEEREKFINAYKLSPPFNPVHSGTLPSDALLEDSDRFSDNIGAKGLKYELSKLEKELQLLVEKRNPRENYPFPPTNFPTYNPDQTPPANADRYRSYIDGLIEEKKEAISFKKQEIDSYPIQNKQRDYFVLSTKTYLEKLNNQSLAQSWRDIDSGVSPLIKFIEYRTPSLRPGQEYRAYFELSRKKLDLITYESYTSDVSSQLPINNQPDNTEDPAVCYDNDSAQTLRTYEEYRAHAIKKRREIQRQLKEQYEIYRSKQRRGAPTEIAEDLDPSQTGRIDLGFAGPFDFNSAFSALYGLNNVMDDREYTRRILSTGISGMSGFLESVGAIDSDSKNLQELIDTGSMFGGSGTTAKKTLENNNDLTITLVNLKQRIAMAAKDIRRAGQIMKREGIELEKGSNFNGANEAQILSRFYNQLVEFLDSSKEGKKILKKAKKSSFSEFPDSEIGMKVNINLRFTFVNVPIKANVPTPHGPKAGKRLMSVSIGVWDGKKPTLTRGTTYNWTIVTGDTLNTKFDALLRARTVNYIAQISYMTSPHNTGSAKDVIVGFFDDGLAVCKELGLDAEKHVSLSLIGMYTTGIKVKKQEVEGFSTIFKTWKDKNFTNPMTKYADTSQQNWESSFKDTFDEDMALRSLGKLCTLEDLYEEFLDKNDLTTLLCSYLECIGLPGFSLKLPKLVLPPFPKIPILGWYIQLLRFIKNNIEQILTRIACSFARTIIDKLAFPFCEEQLEDFIAAGSSASPVLNQALAKAFTDTGIWGFTDSTNEDEPPAKERAKELFEDVAQVVTGEELCYLLEGKPLDEAGMLMVKTLASNNGFANDLNTDESISNFFGVLGSYVPIDICNELSKISRPLGTACSESSDPLRNIRNRLQSGDTSLTPEQTRDVLDIAKANLQQKKESLDAISGMTMDELLPESLKAGNENLVVAQLPGPMKNQLIASVENIFLPAKMSFLSALSSYVPSLSIETAQRPMAGDPGYRDESILRLECNLERLKNFAISVERSRFNSYSFTAVPGGFNKLKPELLIEYSSDSLGTKVTPKQISHLYKVFETERVPIKYESSSGRQYHLVHKRFYPTSKDYLVKFSTLSDNSAHPESFKVEMDLGNSLENEEQFEQVGYEEYVSVTYPEPTDDLNDPAFSRVGPLEEFTPNAQNIQENLSSQQALREGDIVLIKLNRPEGEKDTILKPIAYKSAFLESGDTSFPSYSEGDIPVKTMRAQDEIFLRTSDRSSKNPSADENPVESLYPRVSISKSAAAQAQIKMSSPKNSFAFNCNFNILGTNASALNRDNSPRYYKFNDDGDVLIMVGRDEDYIFSDQDWQKTICPFFSSGHVLSKESHFFPGNLSEETVTKDFARRLIKPVVRTLLLDPEMTGIVEMPADPVIGSSFLGNDPFLANWASVVSGVPRVFHQKHLVNNQRLLEIATERIQELTATIQQELQSVTPVLAQQYMPLVRKVFQKVSRLSVWKRGNAKYNIVPPVGGRSGTYNFLDATPIDFATLNFRATPYSPTLKIAEIATKNNNLDAYNIIIDQDQFLRQGLDHKVGNQDSNFTSTHNETTKTLNPPGPKLANRPRLVLKYCEVLPESVIENNKHHADEVFPEGQDFSKRESYAQSVIKLFNQDFGGHGRDFSDISGQAKTMGFRTATETIFSNLLKNISNSSLYFDDYAAALNTRVSSKAYVIPGTRCLRNRYGLNETGLLSFREMFLKDAIKQIESELTKPEFSPFNRSFGDPGPFPSAMKKIAFKAFVKACLIDGVLKGGLAYSVWGMEPVVSQKLYIDYMIEHVTTELNYYSKMRYAWGQIVEEIVPGTNNKTEALAQLVKEELLHLPALSRQIFNPGMGYRDFFNWYHIGRGRDPSGDRTDNINLPKTGKSYFTETGLFRRLPIPMKVHVDESSRQYWEFEDYPENKRESDSAYVFQENNSETTYSKSFSPSGFQRGRKKLHKSVNEYILQDYVRISGDILHPLKGRPAGSTIPPETIVGFSSQEHIYRTPAGAALNYPQRMAYLNRGQFDNFVALATDAPFPVFWFGWHMQQLIQHRIAYEILRPDSRIPGATPIARRDFLKQIENSGASYRNMFSQYFFSTNGFLDEDELMPRGFIGQTAPNRVNRNRTKFPDPKGTFETLKGQGRDVYADALGIEWTGEWEQLASSGEVKLEIVTANLLVSARIVATLSQAFGVNLTFELNNRNLQHFPENAPFIVDFFKPIDLSWNDVSSDIISKCGLRFSIYPGMPLHNDDISIYKEPSALNRIAKYTNNSYSDDGSLISVGPLMPTGIEYPATGWGGVVLQNASEYVEDTDFIAQQISVLNKDFLDNDRVDYDFEGIPLDLNESAFITPVRDLQTETITDLDEFDSIVVNLSEFDSILDRMASRITGNGNLTPAEHWSRIMRGSKFYHGVRLNNVVMATKEEIASIEETLGTTGTYVSKLLDKFKMRNGTAFEPVRKLSIKEKCYDVTSLNTEGERLFGISIPVKGYEVEIDIQKCADNFNFARRSDYYAPYDEDFISLTNSIETSLFETDECKALMEHIFPIRRYTAMATLTATSALAGYGRMPDLLDPFKSLLGFITHIANNSDAIYGNGPSGVPIILTGMIDQAEFQKKMSDSFPGDTDDSKCLEFPDLGEEFWKNFFKTLGELALYFPSVLFRGLANKMDPMYKEMRSHYLNCDIKDLNWYNVGWQSPEDTLVNGLNPKNAPQGTRSGDYTNLLALGPDMILSTMTVLVRPEILLRTVSKLVSYATTGAIPLIDLSSAFKVPCADIDENWLPGGKYDFGKYGRYGHPLSPLTVLALSTLQLPADIEKRDANCEESESPSKPDVSEQECDDVE